MTSYLLCAAAYVAGSIPFGMLFARAKGIDLRQVGSGNIGATNVARAMGKGWAIAVLRAGRRARASCRCGSAGDSALSALVIACAGGAAIVGHMFTLFLRGRGGKGVATSLGVAMALSPIAARWSASAPTWWCSRASRLSSLGSLLGVWTFALLFVLRARPPHPAHGARARRRGARHLAPPREHRAPRPRPGKADLVQQTRLRTPGYGQTLSTTPTASVEADSVNVCVAMRAPVLVSASSGDA